MKALFIILFLSSAVYAQENPWENKNKENPWGNQTKEVEKKDSVQSNNNLPKIDSVSTTVVVFERNQPAVNESMLIDEAQEKAASEYKNGNDFAVGFATGLFLNVFGIVPDIPYVLIDSKQEKSIESEISSDSTYTNVNKEKLKTSTKKTMKGKKFFSTVGGTVLGSMVQVVAFATLLIAL